MREESLRHGALGWVELMTTDVKAAKKFYTSIFGWETEKAPMEGMEYTMVKVGGEAVGGVMQAPAECEGQPPCWHIYVTVDDVDATAKKVKAHGGKVLRAPEDIPGVGRFCVIQDPQGGVISAISYVREQA